MSTLITAVLTHHLGWVTTVMPSINAGKEKNCPGNPLWGQLIDLYGATGYPTKVCHTIITGCDKNDLISKILNILTYFIRCNNITRSIALRENKDDENALAEKICLENFCIPKENYKKYEDHVREMTEENTNYLNRKTTKKSVGLKKSQTFLKDINVVPDKKVDKDFQLLPNDEDKVLFLLGDNEKLIGINKEKGKDDGSNKSKFDDVFEEEFKSSIFKDSDFVWNADFELKPSTSCVFLNGDKFQTSPPTLKESLRLKERSQSVPREPKPEPSKSNTKYRYSGVKFNFKQYPQIFTNYMKSKDIELSSLVFHDKEIDTQKLSSYFDCTNVEPDFDDMEALETPSNATELEFTNEMAEETSTVTEKKIDKKDEEEDYDKESINSDIQVVQFPMPK